MAFNARVHVLFSLYYLCTFIIAVCLFVLLFICLVGWWLFSHWVCVSVCFLYLPFAVMQSPKVKLRHFGYNIMLWHLLSSTMFILYVYFMLWFLWLKLRKCAISICIYTHTPWADLTWWSFLTFHKLIDRQYLRFSVLLLQKYSS